MCMAYFSKCKPLFVIMKGRKQAKCIKRREILGVKPVKYSDSRRLLGVKPTNYSQRYNPQHY